jgi:hypothetical protein
LKACCRRCYCVTVLALDFDLWFYVLAELAMANMRSRFRALVAILICKSTPYHDVLKLKRVRTGKILCIFNLC